MRPTLSELEAFVWTARLGSVQGAARRLNLAQPTVSLRLKSLQSELGVAVFERASGGIKLSRDGEHLFGYATTILDGLGQMRESAKAAGGVRGTVKVGLPETFAVACLPTLLREVKSDYPGLRLELAVSTSSDLERDLLEHRLDLAFLVHPSEASGLRLIQLGRQEVGWIAAPSLGLGPRVRPADLQDCPLLSNPPPSAMHRQIMNWFRAADIEPRRLDFCTGQMVIAHLVEEGVAVAFLPFKLMEAALAAGSVTHVCAIPAIPHPYLCAAHRVGAASREVQAVISVAQHAIELTSFLLPLQEDI